MRISKSLCLASALAMAASACTTAQSTQVGEVAVKHSAIDVQSEGHLLDGMTIDWTYRVSGSGMNLSFKGGLARYEWTSGARKGRKAQDIPYKSRMIGDDMYLINWVQPEKPDFITLIFDFKNKSAFSSGLIGYGMERQVNLFLDGTIERVDR